MTTIFFQVSTNMADEEWPVENCSDEKTDGAECPDCHCEKHKGHYDALNGGEITLITANLEGKIFPFGDGVECYCVENLTGSFC
jgi:hypothetical protein